MTNTSLKVLLSEWKEIQSDIESDEGIITSLVESRLNNLDVLLPEKIDAYGFILDKFESEVEFWDKRADESANEARKYSELIDAIKRRLKILMTESNVLRLEGNQTAFSIGTCKQALDIYDETAIPVGFFEEEINLKLNKARLREEMESGIEIPGARLLGGFSLRKTLKTKTKD